MIKVCVENDTATGICHSHDDPINVTGYIKASQDHCYVVNKKAIVDGDTVQFNCGHTGICKSGNRMLELQGKKIIVHGDVVISGTGTITNGKVQASQSLLETI